MLVSKKISYVFLGQVVNTIFNFLMLPYLARYLNIVDYGTYGQVLLIGEISLIIFSVGLAQTLYVQFSYKNNNNSNVFVSNLFISLFLGLVSFIIILLLSNNISVLFNNNNLAKLLKIYSVSIVFQLVSIVLSNTLIYYDKVSINIKISVASNLIRLALMFIAIQIFKSLSVLFILITISFFITFVLLLICIPRDLFLGKVKKNIIVKLFKIGIPLGITGVVGILLKRTDGLMISYFFDEYKYGIFRMGLIDIPFLFLIFTSISTIILPEVTKMVEDRSLFDVVKYKKKIISNTITLIYPALIFIIIFSYPLLGFYLGEKYEQSITIFIIYNFVLFIRVNDYRDILIAKSKTKEIMYYVIIVFVLNVVLNVILIKFFDIYGAAIASVISLYTLAFMLVLKTIKLTKTSIISFFDINLIFKVVLISVILSLIDILIYNLLPSLITIGVLFFIYIVIIYTVFIKVKILDKDIVFTLIKDNVFLNNIFIRYIRIIERI